MYVLPQDQADCLVPEAESCRLCGYGDPVGNFVDLLDISSEGLRLSVCQHLDVQVCSADGRSSKLCEHCRTRLEDWMQFYNKCRVFQQVLHTPSVPVNEDDNQDVDRKEDVAAVAESVSKHLEELVEELVREGSVVNDASVDITRDANDASQQRMAEEEDVYTEGEYEDDLCSEEANEVDDEEYSAEDKYGSNPSSIKHRIRQKKFTFTIPFLERKVNRKFSPAERAKLQKHISKRQNTLIYESLIGGGPNQLWNCQICDKVLRGRSNEVKKHYIKVHQSQPILPCHVCDYTSRTEKMYQAHRMSHLVEYPCAHCGKIFTQHSRLVYHMNSHTNERQFECELCDKKFNTAQYVKTHKRKVHGDQEKLLKYTCELCGMRFKYKNHLQYHQKRHPTDDNPLPYSCKYCQERFVTRAEQLAHSNTVHAGEGEYVCHLCGKKMKTILSLENHVKLHSGVKEFKCGQCGAAFATNHSLKCHKKIHERNEAGDGADGMGGYSCPVCKKTMSNKSSLNQHLKTHMGTKPYQCQHCAASFIHKNRLDIHMRKHTGEFPHSCPDCGKGFRSTSSMNSHRQYVHSERKFSCQVCSKAFKTSRDLKVHATLHTGEKPNVCLVCGKAFRVRANYFKHRKIHARMSNTIVTGHAAPVAAQVTREQVNDTMTAVSHSIEASPAATNDFFLSAAEQQWIS